MKWLRFPRTLGIVAVLYLVGMAVVFALLSWQASAFVRHADTTSGTVVALVARAPLGSTREPRNDSRMRSLAPQVAYVVDGKTYDYVAAHGRYRQTVRVGDTLTVLYDPTDPSMARLRGEDKALGPVLTGGFVLGALVVLAVLFRTRRLGTDAPVRPDRRPRTDEVEDPAEDDGDDRSRPERAARR